MHLALGITFEIIAFINAIFGIIIYSMYIHTSPSKKTEEKTETVYPNNVNPDTGEPANPVTITKNKYLPNSDYNGAITLLIFSLFLLGISAYALIVDIFTNTFYDYYETPKSILRGKNKKIAGLLFVLLFVNYIGMFYYIYSPNGIKKTVSNESSRNNVNAMMAISYVFLIYIIFVCIYFLINAIYD